MILFSCLGAQEKKKEMEEKKVMWTMEGKNYKEKFWKEREKLLIKIATADRKRERVFFFCQECIFSVVRYA